jgi:hypothetical protein
MPNRIVFLGLFILRGLFYIVIIFGKAEENKKRNQNLKWNEKKYQYKNNKQ